MTNKQHMQELAAYRFTVDNLRARVAELEAQLAAAPQAVQPEVPSLAELEAEAELVALRDVYETARGFLRYDGIDAERALKARNGLMQAIETVKTIDGGYWEPAHPAEGVPAQAAQPSDALIEVVDAWFAENTGLGGCSDKDVAELAAIFATQPAAPGLADDGMYYLQDARWSALVGNCPSFWREGGGYTTNLDEAERFTLEAAMKQHKCRETDLPWLCTEVDKLRRPTVDCQFMPRSWDAQRSALAAQAKQGE